MTNPMTPAQFDAKELEFMTRLEAERRVLEALIEKAHRTAGDMRTYTGWGTRRVTSWQLTDDEAVQRAGMSTQVEGQQEIIDAVNSQVSAMEEIYNCSPWQRYFPCLNADGHIHASLRGCPTVRWDTSMGWATEMSGLTPDQAIHEGIPGEFPALGETLCSVCFPDAPAAWCRTRSEVTRAEREAARAAKNAARNAVKAVKELTNEEVAALWEVTGERVTTVAAAKTIVREPAETEVEIEWYRSSDARKKWADPLRLAEVIGNMERRLTREKAAADLANEILTSREADAPGTGWTQADADRAVASATRRARKAYFG